MIDPDALRDFMHGFHGYGGYDAKYWFVGLEEGGASSVDDLAKRIAAWRRLGSAETEDLYEFHREIGFTGWFGASPKRQATWARLVQIVLMAEGRRCEAQDIVRYQADNLGRVDGETLLSEALPLPAKNLTTWYAEAVDLPELRSRREYTRVTRPPRIAHLKQRISEKQPRSVIFYGAQRSWPSLLGLDFERCGTYDRTRLGSTLLLTMKHPTAWGARADDFAEVARAVAGT
jgi:hypothetical protein